VKYAAVQAHRHCFDVALMCRALGISRSGFYAARRREASARAREDERLRQRIGTIHHHSRRTYGSPRVQAELRVQGVRTSRKRVARLMREAGLCARTCRRRRTTTTDSRHAEPVAANLLERRFGVASHGTLDRVWVSDLTYVPTREGWLYLAVVLDLASRRVVGWAMRSTLERSLTLDALRMALWQRRPAAGLVHHSDRGVQYAAGEYQRVLAAQGLVCSMSRKGDCWDNAVAESFFSTLEWELIGQADWHTRAEARRAIFDYIEVWYNRQRRHSSLGYRSPAEYEQHLALMEMAA
jgi:putative transposase